MTFSGRTLNCLGNANLLVSVTIEELNFLYCVMHEDNEIQFNFSGVGSNGRAKQNQHEPNDQTQIQVPKGDNVKIY
jgi:hypothetical protein